jgi:hypothetical protein
MTNSIPKRFQRPTSPVVLMPTSSPVIPLHPTQPSQATLIKKVRGPCNYDQIREVEANYLLHGIYWFENQTNRSNMLSRLHPSLLFIIFEYLDCKKNDDRRLACVSQAFSLPQPQSGFPLYYHIGWRQQCKIELSNYNFYGRSWDKQLTYIKLPILQNTINSEFMSVIDTLGQDLAVPSSIQASTSTSSNTSKFYLKFHKDTSFQLTSWWTGQQTHGYAYIWIYKNLPVDSGGELSVNRCSTINCTCLGSRTCPVTGYWNTINGYLDVAIHAKAGDKFTILNVPAHQPVSSVTRFEVNIAICQPRVH